MSIIDGRSAYFGWVGESAWLPEPLAQEAAREKNDNAAFEDLVENNAEACDTADVSDHWLSPRGDGRESLVPSSLS
jgi:hypothetical protein